MALTIAIEGKGLIANCNALSDSAGGTWSEQGGGTISVSEDVFFIRSASIGGKYAGKVGFHQYDIGAGNELDFTPSTGTESGQLLGIWVAMTAPGTLDVLSTYPFCIRLSSDAPGTSNYIDYLINSSDDNNGWNGSWKFFAVDPTLTPSRVSGTQSSIIASVRTMGIWIDCSGSARADSIFVNEMIVGSGLRITGTSTTGFQDIVDYCTDYTTRGWGMYQRREGITYSYGKTYIGDSANQAADVSFADSGRKIQFGFTEYCTNAATGTWASSVATDSSGVILEDHTSYKTEFTDGILVGSDNGRSGTAFIGNALMDVSFDASGMTNASSFIKCYNTQLEKLAGGITYHDDANSLYYGGNIIGCGQFAPAGAAVLRNLTISGYSGTLGAMLWDVDINIQKTKFIANTDITNDPSAIEHDVNDSDSGTVTTADATGVTLTDTAATFNTWGVATDDIVYNRTDDSWAKVVSVTSETVLVTAGLADGTDNEFAVSDAYDIAYPIAYTDLEFSGNDYDVINSTLDALAISKSGTSDPSTYSPSGDWVAFLGSVTLEITVQNESKVVIQDAQTSLHLLDSPFTALMNEDTNALGVASENYSGTTPVQAVLKVRKSESTDDPRYEAYSDIVTIDSNGLTRTVTMKIQPLPI